MELLLSILIAIGFLCLLASVISSIPYLAVITVPILALLLASYGWIITGWLGTLFAAIMALAGIISTLEILNSLLQRKPAEAATTILLIVVSVFALSFISVWLLMFPANMLDYICDDCGNKGVPFLKTLEGVVFTWGCIMCSLYFLRNQM